MHTPRSDKVLVIGYGNDLRGDDGAGRMVADRIAEWEDPAVSAVSAHQLGPEFAIDIAASRMTIFVDAFPACQPVARLIARAGVDGEDSQAKRLALVAATPGHPLLLRLHPVDSNPALGHSPTPSMLLTLARALYGRSPRTYLVGIPAMNLEFGDAISADTRAAVAEAVEMVKALATLKSQAVRKTEARHERRQVIVHA